jgi:hypothetical protein
MNFIMRLRSWLDSSKTRSRRPKQTCEARLLVEALERRELLSAMPLNPIPTFTAPTSLTSATTPTITWTADAGPTRYDLWVNDTTAGVAQLIRQQNLFTNSFTPVTPLAVGHQYTAWVEAFNGSGQTAGWSQPLVFTIAAIVPPTVTAPASTTSDPTPLITWTASSGAARYDLWVNDTSAGIAQVIRQQSLTTTSFVPPTSLTVGHQYTTWVEAFTNTGVASGWSQPLSFSIVAATPTITGPVGSTSATMPSITWTTSAGAVRYDLWVNDTTANVSQFIRQQNLTTTSYMSSTSLTVGHQYTAWVQAFDSSGQTGGWSPAASFSVVATVPPTFTGPAASATSLPAITWTASSGAVRYDLWLNDTTANVAQVIRQQNLSTTFFTPATPLIVGHQYTAWVQALDSSGQTGGWSQPLTFSVIATTPPTLTGPNASPTSALPTITWTTSSGAASYELWLTDATTGAEVIDRQGLTTTFFTPPAALAAGHQYTTWVLAFDASGQTGGWSQPLSFLVQGVNNGSPTAAFTNDGPMAQGDTATVSFTGATGGSGGYAYSYDFDNNGIFEISNSGAAQATVPSFYLSTAGNHVVHGRITDSSGAFADYTTVITVNAVNSPPTATFANGGPVTQGSTATVSFSGATGGSGGYTYSYDFDNNGIFEISNSSVAQATVPAFYLTTVGGHVVHGRITDSSGSFTDYTTTIIVNGLPTATFTSGGAVDLGQTANVSFSGATGGSGGYTYSYDFNNNGTFEISGTGSAEAVVPGLYLGTVGSHIVHGRITDSSGNFSDYTTTITVNALPTATFTNSGPVGQGSTATASFSAASGGSGGYTYSYDFDNNGTFEISNSGAAQATVPALYLATAGSHVIRGRITDSSGGFTDYTTTVTVNAASSPPTAAFTSGGAVDLGQTATVSFSGASGGSGGYTYSYDFNNNGAFEISGSSSGEATVPASYLNTAGSHVVHGRITDSSGAFTDYTTTVTVSALPTATFTNGGTVDIGQAATVSFSGAGGGSGGYTYSFDFNNNGTFEISGSASAQATVPASYLSTAGSHVVRGRITDSKGGFTDYTTTITVNALPTATFTNGGAVDLGQTATVSFSGAAGGSGGYTYSYDFNNNGTFEISGSASAQATVPASYLNTAGSHVVHGRITDSSGGFTDFATTITVNALPTATFNNNGPVSQGSTATVSFSGATGGSGGYTYSYDFNNDGTYEISASASAQATVPASYLSSAGGHIVHGRITDSKGGFTDYTTTVTVNAVSSPPTATFTNSGPVNVGSTATVSFSGAGGGSGGYTYSYDFNNDGTFEISGSSSAQATVPGSYLSTSGSHVVHGRITDSSGAFSDYTTTITVNGGSSSGHTYYVATNGKDSNSGSAAAPFATLQQAMMSLHPGDTLNVEPGSYAGFVAGWDSAPATSGDLYGTVAGTAAAPITIQADPSAAPGSVIINTRANEVRYGIDLEPGCDYVHLIGFTIADSGGITTSSDRGGGIKVVGNNDQVINNTVTNIVYGFGIIADNANNVVLKNNTVTGTGSQGNDNYGHGIYLSGSLDGAVVQGNVIHNNDLIGIHINGDVSEGGVGLVTHALIENNFIYNNGQNGINADGLQSSVIENNLIYGYQNYGIALYQIDASAGSKNNVIVNNTIVSTVSGAGAAVRILDGGTGNTILNNILLGGGGIALRISNDSLSGLVSNYNIGGSSYFQSEDSGSTQTLAQWRTQKGQDANSLTATTTQLFVNASGNNYHLASGSPAINAGTNTDAPATDILGIARPLGQIDIGAYQG